MTARAQLQDRYASLCAERDAINARIEPIKARLAAKVDALERAKADANTLVTELNDARGGERWLTLKTEIASLARQLSRPD